MRDSASNRAATLELPTHLEARAILSAVFAGKLTATPVLDQHGPGFIVEGDASVGRMLAYERDAERGSLEIHTQNLRPQGER